MRTLFIGLVIAGLTACGPDNITYPKLYTFSHVDQTEEGLFVLSNTNTAYPIDFNLGNYGSNREYFKELSAEIMSTIFDLQEIELLSENTVRIHFAIDEIETDTIVSYSFEEETIIIEYLSSTDLIYHDSESDQFVLCGFTLVALPGPNVINPGIDYNMLLLEDCQNNANLDGHLNFVLEQNKYKTLDTIGLIINKFIYK